jgi:transcriptional regulator GlxA family with amidase domain
MSKNVAILIFDEVEVLDFAGPFEVFNVAGEVIDPSPFRVYTVAETTQPIKARGQLSINPHYPIHSCPPPEILLIPGGIGTRRLLRHEVILEWLRTQAGRVEYLLSVCTGSLLLGQAGLLDGLGATTHHTAFDLLRQVAPTATVYEDRRYVDNGRIITSAGISAGLDMTLYVVKKLLGEAGQQATLAEMEYHWQPEAET